MQPDCVDRAIRNVATELLVAFSLRRKMEAARSPEMLVCATDTHAHTCVYNPEDHNLNTHYH